MMLRPSEDEENLIKWFYWILRTDNFNPILSMQTDNSAFDSWWVVLFGSSFLTLELKGQQQIWQMHNQGNHNFFLLFPYIFFTFLLFPYIFFTFLLFPYIFFFFTFPVHFFLDYTEILMTMDLEASRPNQDIPTWRTYWTHFKRYYHVMVCFVKVVLPIGISMGVIIQPATATALNQSWILG